MNARQKAAAILGSAKSERKTAACRKNAKRPRKKRYSVQEPRLDEEVARFNAEMLKKHKARAFVKLVSSKPKKSRKRLGRVIVDEIAKWPSDAVSTEIIKSTYQKLIKENKK